MARRSDEVDLNPFAPNAIKEQSTRRFSTDQERANVAPELAQLRQEGYVILPRLIDQSKVQEVAVEFERCRPIRRWAIASSAATQHSEFTIK